MKKLHLPRLRVEYRQREFDIASKQALLSTNRGRLTMVLIGRSGGTSWTCQVRCSDNDFAAMNANTTWSGDT